MEKCNVKALAIGVGTVFGLYILFIGWAASFGWGTRIVDMISSLYIGYEASFLGGIVGGIWGFIDGAIAGAIIAWIYNAVNKK